MGYIARNLTKNEVYYSKGANKIGSLVGCSASTITKFYLKEENKGKDRHFTEWIISKCIDICNKNRGFTYKKGSKSLFNREK